MKLIKPSTAGGSNPSRFKTGNQSPKPNNALFATHRINICIITTAKNDPNYSARSAHRLLTPIIVIKERSKPNTSARTVNMPYSAGKPFCTSLFTNAAMITALTALMPSTNSTQRKNSYKKRNLLNSSSATYTANIYSKLQNLFTPARSNLSSTSEESTTLKTSSDSSWHSTSPSLSLPAKLPISCKMFLISASLTRPSSITPSPQPTTATASTLNLKALLTTLLLEMKPISKSSENGPTFFCSYRQRTWYSLPITSRTPAKLCLPSLL